MREKERRRSPTASELAEDACRRAELWQAILRQPVDGFVGEAKGDERGVPGLFIADSNLRRGLGFLAGGGDPAARREAVRERETSAKGGR
jgi:hypothetical protein